MFGILVIDNDKASAEEISTFLKAEGYKVDISPSAYAGLLQLQSYDYDIAVIDWNLPDMAGAEICRRIANSNLRLPVMMLSSRQGIEDTVQGLDSGAQDFMSKPLQLLELSARLRSLLRRYAKNGIPRAMTATPVVPPVSQPFNAQPGI